ncbi:MAG: phosphopantetheine-binding protein [Rhizomicrobium sp.]
MRSAILAIFQSVAKEQQKQLGPLSDDLPLLETGLDSLCMAIIVARLEDLVGFDPFDTEVENEFPVTVGDFVKFYEDAAAISSR